MPDWLRQSLTNGQEIHFDVLLLRLLLALLMGCVVAIIYYWTHRRDGGYSSSFVATLVLMTILIAMVTQVIGENIARAFSLVGALSIVRFRTVVEDTRDTAFVIFAVIEGMAVGAGYPEVAAAGIYVVGSAAILVRPRKEPALPPSGDWQLALRIAIGQEVDPALDAILTKHASRCQLNEISTSRQGSAIDRTYLLNLRVTDGAALFLNDLNQLKGIQSVDLRRR